MNRDDRVEFCAHWSSFFGMKGTVVATKPFLMVLLDGDRHPVRVGDREVRPLEPQPAVTP